MATSDATHKRSKAQHATLEIWTRYRVRWEFLTRLCASVPADPEVIRKWLEAREPRVKAPGARSIDAINEEVLASLERGEGEPSQDFQLLVFQHHADAIVMGARTVRAHLKDCARIFSAQFVGKIQGERSFATRIINGVYLDKSEYWLPVTRPDGSVITRADGAYDKAIHVRGSRGEPLNALKRFEYIDPPSVLEFTLNVLGKSATLNDLDHIFEYGGTHGYAGERGDGEGKYTHSIEQIAGGRAETGNDRGHGQEE